MCVQCRSDLRRVSVTAQEAWSQGTNGGQGISQGVAQQAASAASPRPLPPLPCRSYILLGLIRREDAYLDMCTASACIVGVVAGNSLSGRIGQENFSRVLVGLMCVCCVLLFGAAAGLTGR